jgi:histidine triad (HIT) family protein
METTTPQSCIFCDIASKNIASNILYETDTVMVIQDIMPQAPVHVLVMPKRHIVSVNELVPEDAELISEIVLTGKEYAKSAGIAESGYKLVFNIGKEGGQIIPHLHMHLMGGKQLSQ